MMRAIANSNGRPGLLKLVVKQAFLVKIGKTMSFSFEWQNNSMDLDIAYIAKMGREKASNILTQIKEGTKKIGLLCVNLDAPSDQVKDFEEAFKAYPFGDINHLRLNITKDACSMEFLYHLAAKITKLTLNPWVSTISKMTMSELTNFILKCSAHLRFVEILGASWQVDDVVQLISEGFIQNRSLGAYGFGFCKVKFGREETIIISECLQKDCRIDRLELSLQGDMKPFLSGLSEYLLLYSLKLNISSDFLWSEDDLDQIISSCPSLSELAISDDASRLFFSKVLSLSSLEKFEYGTRTLFGQDKVSIEFLPGTLKRIEGYWLNFAASSDAVEDIDCTLDFKAYEQRSLFSACPNLKHLAFKKNDQICPPLFFQDLRNNPRLESLRISRAVLDKE
jgi:hypothetical protein